MAGRLEIRDADDKTVRTLRLESGRIPVADPPDPEWMKELDSLYVVGVNGGTEQLTPRDGDEWLRGLQINYRSIYFRGVFIPE